MEASDKQQTKISKWHLWSWERKSFTLYGSSTNCSGLPLGYAAGDPLVVESSEGPIDADVKQCSSVVIRVWGTIIALVGRF